MPSFRIDYILFDNPMRAIHYQSVAEVPSDHKWIAAKLQIGDLFMGD
jgi:endonuclease/exonuclease/phosphatase family metal-dependent hydrolase